MVAWKKLGEIGDVCMCKRIMKHQTFDKGDVPFFKIGTFGGTADAFINRDLFLEYKSKFSFPQKGDILLSASGTIGRTVVYNGEDAYFQDSNIVWISNDESQVTNAFLYYCYQIVEWKIDGGTIKRLYNYNLKNTIIPVPSLSEQNRIVAILDTFTSSIENLKKQIAERLKQYEHYRDQLLDLEGKEGVEMKSLGEICDTLSGFPFDSAQFSEEGIQLMRGMNIKRGYFDFSEDNNKYWKSSEGLEKYLLEANDIIISMDGSLVGRSFCYLKEEHLPLLLVQRVARIRTKENYKYIYYNISKRFPDYVDKKKTAGAIPHISMKDINGFIIPLPSKEEQSRIVSILDTFEASISNLEAQLSQREKQYEYYRNKLLTFE